jgi:hypothetical protein
MSGGTFNSRGRLLWQPTLVYHDPSNILTLNNASFQQLNFDAFLQQTASKTLSVDSILTTEQVVSASMDSMILKLQSMSTGLDSILISGAPTGVPNSLMMMGIGI